MAQDELSDTLEAGKGTRDGAQTPSQVEDIPPRDENLVTPENEFALRRWDVQFGDKEYTLLEPTLAQALELQDEYFDLVVTEASDGDRRVSIKMREAQYVRAICTKFIIPSINVDRIPLRHQRKVRLLVADWEGKTGFSSLAEALQGRLSGVEDAG